MLSKIQRENGHFVVIDMHSYNHHRSGPDGPFDDPLLNPDINIGTGTMMNRQIWEGIIGRFMQDLKKFDFNGRSLAHSST